MTIETICDTCGMSYDWPGVTLGDRVYCCAACANGLRCTCPQHGHAWNDTVVVGPGETVVVAGGRDTIIVE